jgi:hypothetical protein
MAVFQPLYYAAGKYSADTDRRLLAALFDTNQSDGLPVSGVIPSYFDTNSMKVSSNGTNMTLTIQTGMCIIADAVTPSADDPGLYLAGLYSDETLTIPVNPTGSSIVDIIYAVVDETGYVVTNKVLTSNTATLTTSTNHGFKIGETVVVSGVDAIYDGTHTITAVQTTSPFTFSYSKTNDPLTSTAVTATVKGYDGTGYFTRDVINKSLSLNIATIQTATTHGLVAGRNVTISGIDGTFDGTYPITSVTSDTISYVVPRVVNNVNSTAVASSSLARARVPFAIKAERTGGSTLATKTKLEIARVSVPPNSAEAIPLVGGVVDTRKYTNLLGGVAYYNSTDTESQYHPAASAGRLRYDTEFGRLQIYDNVDSTWRSIYNTASNNHDTKEVDSAADALHHTLGTTQYQAAAGNHGHSNVYVETTDGVVSSADVNAGVVRNIYLSTSPTGSGGTDGDVWLTYTP